MNPASFPALIAATTGILCKVVTHHQPRPVGRADTAIAYWQCTGCDLGVHAEDLPDWPCTTIYLIAEELHIPLEPTE